MSSYSQRYRDYVAGLLDKLTSASYSAVEADAQVKHHVRRIDEYTTDKSYTDHSARQKKMNDPQLTDAVEAYRKACSEVQRIYATLAGVIATVEFLDRPEL